MLTARAEEIDRVPASSLARGYPARADDPDMSLHPEQAMSKVVQIRPDQPELRHGNRVVTADVLVAVVTVVANPVAAIADLWTPSSWSPV